MTPVPWAAVALLALGIFGLGGGSGWYLQSARVSLAKAETAAVEVKLKAAEKDVLTRGEHIRLLQSSNTSLSGVITRQGESVALCVNQSSDRAKRGDLAAQAAQAAAVATQSKVDALSAQIAAAPSGQTCEQALAEMREGLRK